MILFDKGFNNQKWRKKYYNYWEISLHQLFNIWFKTKKIQKPKNKNNTYGVRFYTKGLHFLCLELTLQILRLRP